MQLRLHNPFECLFCFCFLHTALCAKISRLQSRALGQSMSFRKVCRLFFFFFTFHYIVFNFLPKNNAFDDLAAVAAQNNDTL